MLIDWSTVLFQLLNFGILIWLLKRFLYKPILRNMDRREERIAARLEKAREREKEAAREQERFRQKSQELEDRRRELVGQAEKEADQRREQLMEEVRQEAEEKRRSWKQSLAREKELFLRDLSRRAGEAVFKSMRRALHELSGVNVQEQLVRVFADKLRNLDGSTREKMRQAVRDGKDLTVRSAFDLSNDDQDMLSQVLEEQFEVRPHFFEVDPDMIAGVAVETGGREVSWSVRDYLSQMQREFEQVLEQSSRDTGDQSPSEAEGRDRQMQAEDR